MKNLPQKHVCAHVTQLARLLGLGELDEHAIRKVWVEPGTDYVHMMFWWTGEGPAPEGYFNVSPGGVVDTSFAPAQMARQIHHLAVGDVTVQPGDKIVSSDGRRETWVIA